MHVILGGPTVNPVQFQKNTGRTSVIVEKVVFVAFLPFSHVHLANLIPVRKVGVRASFDLSTTLSNFTWSVITYYTIII